MDCITVTEDQDKKEKKIEKEEEPIDRSQDSIGIGALQSLQAELIIDILSRVPTLELPKLKYVCKNWNDIILSDPVFHHLHYTRSNSNENRVLVLKRSSELYFVDLSDINIPRQIAIHLPYVPDNFSDYYFLGSCNGLLCLGNGGFSRIFILNPFTRQHLMIVGVGYDTRPGHVWAWGLGFGEIAKLFKVILLFVCLKNNGDFNLAVRVCDLGSGGSKNWRNLETADYVSVRSSAINSTACFINGRLHWLYWRGDSLVIISFDLADEEFRFIPVPDDILLNRDNVLYFDMIVLGGCLCIFYNKFFSPGTLRAKAWVMKEYGVKASWTKILDNQPVIPRSLRDGLRENLSYKLLCGLEFVKDGELVITTDEGALLICSDLTCDDLKLLPLERVSWCGLIAHTCSLNWI